MICARFSVLKRFMLTIMLEASDGKVPPSGDSGGHCGGDLTEPMSLLYDNYGIRRLAVEVNLWPEVEKFEKKALSKLFGVLNTDGMFASCELRPETGARFESDTWTYDVSPAGVFMRCVNLASLDDTKQRMHFLLDGTRKCVATGNAFYTDEIRVFVHVPEGGKRNVESVAYKKLLGTRTDRSDLPGLEGAGLSLSGTTEIYHWHGDITPYGEDALMLTAVLTFRPNPEPPRPGPDLDAIDGQIGTAASFATDHLRTFSSKFIQ